MERPAGDRGQFFNEFGHGSPNQRVFVNMNQGQGPSFPEKYKHNTMVLEIGNENNFPWARWLMNIYLTGELKGFKSEAERDWFNFLTQKGIDIMSYKNDEGEKFIADHFQTDKDDPIKEKKKDGQK